MPETTPPPSAAGAPPPATDDDHAIQERARVLTAQALRQGRVDAEGMRELVRALTGAAASETTPAADVIGAQDFAEEVRRLNAALAQSAIAANVALERLAARGGDYTDNDLKDALLGLRQMERDYVALATRLGAAMTGSMRRELADLAASAQSVGADAGSRVAGMMGDLANRMGESAASGMRTVRGAGVGMALLASGVLAGVADALRERSEGKPDKPG